MAESLAKTEKINWVMVSPVLAMTLPLVRLWARKYYPAHAMKIFMGAVGFWIVHGVYVMSASTNTKKEKHTFDV